MPKGIYPRIAGAPRLWSRRRRAVICLNCSIEFSRPKSDIKRKYCSLKCNRAHYRGSEHWSYVANKFSTQGYRIASNSGSKRIIEHRSIAEKVLGRPLTRQEVVHHIDGDKSNNAHSNLLICTVAYHSWLHAEMSYRYQREKFSK